MTRDPLDPTHSSEFASLSEDIRELTSELRDHRTRIETRLGTIEQSIATLTERLATHSEIHVMEQHRSSDRWKNHQGTHDALAVQRREDVSRSYTVISILAGLLAAGIGVVGYVLR